MKDATPVGHHKLMRPCWLIQIGREFCWFIWSVLSHLNSEASVHSAFEFSVYSLSGSGLKSGSIYIASDFSPVVTCMAG